MRSHDVSSGGHEECRRGVPMRDYIDRFAFVRAALRAAAGAPEERRLGYMEDFA